jgi:hypothetical protein
MQPQDQIVALIVGQLDENLRELFEERAAIVEFDAGLPRAHAECLALLGLLHRFPSVLMGALAVEIEERGERRWMLAADNSLLGDLSVIRTAQLVDVLREHFDGLAALSRASRP